MSRDENAQGENAQLYEEKYKALVENLKEAVTCPVCHDVPRLGPVPMCPNGHFTCTGCKAELRKKGNLLCPTCRVPMADIQSRLATEILENVDHACDLKGCREMVPYSEYMNHQKKCLYRLVHCPGLNCGEVVAYNGVEEHVRSCEDVGDLDWRAQSFEEGNKLYFLRVRRAKTLYKMEVLMKGTEEECSGYKAEVSVLDNDDHEVFRSYYHPRPIGMEEWGNFYLIVGEDSLSKVWRRRDDHVVGVGGGYVFDIAVCIIDSH